MEGKGLDYGLFAFDMAYSLAFLVLGIFLLNKLGAKAAEKL
jgi:ABC-2 type transport system permease protein